MNPKRSQTKDYCYSCYTYVRTSMHFTSPTNKTFTTKLNLVQVRMEDYIFFAISEQEYLAGSRAELWTKLELVFYTKINTMVSASLIIRHSSSTSLLEHNFCMNKVTHIIVYPYSVYQQILVYSSTYASHNYNNCTASMKLETQQ